MSNESIRYWGLAIIIAGLYITLSWITPLSLDDYAFLGTWRDDCHNTSFTWSGWWRFYEFTRGYDNGRLANAVCPIFLLYSPWKELFPIITGALVAFIAVILQRFTTPSQRYSTPALTLIWALMIIGIPWHDTIFVCDYSLNYIWSAGITLSLLWVLRLSMRNRRYLPAAILLAVIAGGWHESFAVTTLCGLGLFAIVRRFRLPPAFYVVIAVYFAATLVFALSPGMIGRFEGAIAEPRRSIGRRSVFIFFVLCAVILSLAVTKKGRKILIDACKSPVMTVCAGILASGYILAFMTVNTARSYFWPDMAAVAMSARLILSAAEGMGRRTLTACTLAGAILCILQTASVIAWQARYTEEGNRVIALIEKSETGTVYYNLTLPEKPPFYTLGIPVSTSWVNPFNLACLQTYYNKPIVIIPENR